MQAAVAGASKGNISALCSTSACGHSTHGIITHSEACANLVLKQPAHYLPLLSKLTGKMRL